MSANPVQSEKSSRSLVVGAQYLVQREGSSSRIATILDTRLAKTGRTEAYVSFAGQDKRLDTWIGEDELGEEAEVGPQLKKSKIEDIKATHTSTDPSTPVPSAPHLVEASSSTSRRFAEPSPSVASTPEREHASMTRVRNFEDVRFGEYLIKTWYYSPYPLPIDEPPHQPSSSAHTTPHRASSPHTPASGSISTSRKRKLPYNNHAEENPIDTPQSHLHRSVSTRTVNDMFASGVGKGGEGARGRLWVCDLCFKYMRTRSAYDRHESSCSTLRPPGKKVYQRGSYTLWEIDGANATLYCQNLSLFGKLFIDHKSVFFHVENFLFYVLCDAATSKRDQVMAFFSKEKLSYDDYNLACIVTFPPFQNRGFGKLLIEFSYYLTKHPSSRPTTLSPGTPERPLSDLGLKGYLAFWVAVILRLFKHLLADAPPLKNAIGESPRKVMSPVKSNTVPQGRSLRVRKEVSSLGKGDTVVIGEVDVTKVPIPTYKGQYSLALTLANIAEACHLRVDDTAFTLSELSFLQSRRKVTTISAKRETRNHAARADDEGDASIDRKVEKERDLGEWKDVEVVITREMVDQAWEKWRVKDRGVLEEEYVLL